MKKNIIIGILSGIIVVLVGGLAIQKFVLKKNFITTSNNTTSNELSEGEKQLNNQIQSMQEKIQSMNDQLQQLKSQNLTIGDYNITLKDSFKLNSDVNISLTIKNIGKDSIDALTKNNIELKLGNTILPSNEITIDSLSSNKKYNPNQEYTLKIHFSIPKNLSGQAISLIFNINGENTILYPFMQ